MGNLELGWTRIQYDTPTYDFTLKQIGVLYPTYGINILEIGNEFVKAFSPDLNKNVLIKKADLLIEAGDQKEGDEDNV